MGTGPPTPDLPKPKGFAKSIMQRAFLAGAAFQHTPPVAAFQHVALPPAGGFASATSGSVAQYAFSIGLDELGASYLASWPQEPGREDFGAVSLRGVSRGRQQAGNAGSPAGGRARARAILGGRAARVRVRAAHARA